MTGHGLAIRLLISHSGSCVQKLESCTLTDPTINLAYMISAAQLCSTSQSRRRAVSVTFIAYYF